MEDWEALLLEIARRAAQQQIGREVEIPVPAEIISEAISQGARGGELSLWIAVVAAVLAVGIAGGGQAVSALPGVVGGAMSSARAMGRGGFHKNAAAELELLLEGSPLKRVSGQGGDFFPGILG